MVATLLFYGLAIVGADAVAPVLYKRIIDFVSSGQEPAILSSALINTVLFLGAILFLNNVFFRIADYSMAYSQSQILRDIANDAFKKVSKHSYEFFSSNFTGTLVAKVRRYINAFETIHDQLVFNLWMKGLALIFAFFILSYFSIILGLILLVWIALYLGIMVLFIRKKIGKDLLTAEANSKVTGALSDAITNILNVKMFSSHVRELAIFNDATSEEEFYRREAWYFQNFQFLFQGFFIAFFEFFGMFTAVYLWIHGAISPGTIILMQIYIFAIFEIVWNIGRNLTRIIRAFAEAKEMVDIFEKPVAIEDPKDPEKVRIEKGKIEMREVSFSYNQGANVFEGLNLIINPGEKVALVGPSGAGKTTITKLLLRFVDVDKGKILIDGQDISLIKQEDLREKIAYVPQDPILFHRTLKENISYSSPEATIEQIIDVAKRSHAHEFIKNFSNGYDTYVGERGVKLSGGERQRVAIARAMLKNSPLLILDEATSSLDSISEGYIQDSFDELMRGRTTIVIAHRLSTIRMMDRIVVFDAGKIVEIGTHDELLKKSGVYAELWQKQVGGFISDTE